MKKAFDRAEYKPGFWALMATQFQGAFSDNLFKYILIFLLLDASLGGADLETSSKIAAMAGMLFAVPYILFPGIFGAIADRFSKQRVFVATKCLEVLIMGLGGLAVWNGDTVFLWAVLFLMATQSALFSPAKYGILPEGLPEDKLSWGNGMLQMGTMVAIIAGVGVAGPLYEYLAPRENVYLASMILVALAFVGLTTSRYVFRPPAANPDLKIPFNPMSGMGASFKVFAADRWLWLSVLAYVYFWFAGAMLQANLFPFGSVILG
ncbi:MAG: MFS transporter, partial [Candidatus Hydrogenedentes bacterium]|nr:MFS transporter [Candidatus Hydrogenedentota bacterium]